MNAAAGYAQALWAGKLFHIDLNGQNGPKYDQDLRFGAGNVRGAFWVVDALLAGGYDGPVHFDFKPARIEDEDGVWVSAAANMRNYLILREKVRAFRADPEVQAALAAARLPELAQPTLADGEGWQQLLEWPLPDPDALAATARRPSTSTSSRSSTSTACADPSVACQSPRPPSGSGGRTCRWCCASLRREGPATRTELAQRTGLAKATVGVIVADLEGAQAVVEEESRTGARGRPGRPVALRGDRFLALGLELNVDYVAGGGPRPGRRGAAGRDPAGAAGRAGARGGAGRAGPGRGTPHGRRPAARPGRRHAGRPRPGARRQPDRRLGTQRRPVG